MGTSALSDRANGADYLRIALNLAGAVGQIAIGYFANVGAVSDEFRSPIVPAGYAFAIWGPIFLLLLMYAIYQAKPGRAADPMLRSIGWFTGLAMVGDTVWTWVFTQRFFIPAQVLIFLIGACAIVALLRYANWFSTHIPTTFEQWVIGPAVGLLAGWLTAAMFVGLAGTLISQGAAATGPAAEIGGAGLLLFAAGVAAAVLVRAATGPRTAWVACGIAVIWAGIGVIVAHFERSMIVGWMTVLIIAVVVGLLALLTQQPRSAAVAA
ncbi:MAG: hypothetical protein ACR2J8_05780 [Thermomicrobiales bacterium]